MSRVTVMDSVTYSRFDEARSLPAAELCSPPTLSQAADRCWRRLGWHAMAGICLALPAASSPSAAEVALVWDGVDDPRVASYQVHYGPARRDYDNHKVATESKVVVAGLQPGRRYYFAVRACAADGVTCSGFLERGQCRSLRSDTSRRRLLSERALRNGALLHDLL